jgi:5-methylcytosine-specific restriction endonuclease McrA
MEVEERDGFRCIICGSTSITPHHITKRSRGGGDFASNLVCLCVYPDDCHNQVEQGKIEIPESKLEEIGYYSKDQKRLTKD